MSASRSSWLARLQTIASAEGSLRGEEEEDHLPATSASGAATPVTGKNSIFNLNDGEDGGKF